MVVSSLGHDLSDFAIGNVLGCASKGFGFIDLAEKTNKNCSLRSTREQK